MQTKKDIESWYDKVDPWNYTTTQDDIDRKEKILSFIEPCETALDIGAGEGWITKDIPAKKIYGIEISDTASARFPENVTRITEPEGIYDLILCTGMLYGQYDHKQFSEWILRHSKKAVLSNIKDWEILDPQILDRIVYEETYKYREFEQHLIILDNVSTS